MSNVLLTANQKYSIGVQSGSAVIEASTDSAEGKKIIRNRVLISGSHEPHVFGSEPSLKILQGQGFGIHVIGSGSAINGNAAVYLENTVGGDSVVTQYVNGTAVNVWTSGVSQTDGSYRIADATTLSVGGVRQKMSSNGNIEFSGRDIRITGSDDVVVSADMFMITGSNNNNHLYVDVNRGSGQTFSAEFHNGIGKNSLNYEGIKIRCGQNANNDTGMVYIGFYEGDNVAADYIVGDGAGGARFTGTAQATYSDKRNKNSIIPIEKSSLNPQGILNNIDIVEFKYNAYDWQTDEVKEKKNTERRIGAIAQAMESSSLNYVVKDNDVLNTKQNKKPGDLGFKYKEIDYEQLVPLLIQTSKEQYLRITELENRITILEGNA